MTTLEKKVLELEIRISKLEALLSEGSPSVPLKSKRLSVREFLKTKNTSSEAQKVLVIGYYLEYIDGLESFSVSDIENMFRSAKEKLPVNTNAVVNKNIEKGFIMEAAKKKEAKKAWVLTSTGEKYVDDNFNPK